MDEKPQGTLDVTPNAPTEDNGYGSFVQNMQAMNSIVREMKEVAELPSEKPKEGDTSALERVEFPEAGGVLTYMTAHAYPYKGFPYYEFVEKVDLIKKISRGFVSGLYHSLKGKNIVKLIFLVPVAWFFKDILRIGIYTAYRIVSRFRMKRERYCDAVRELYRAFNGNGEEDLRTMLRDVVCMVLEFDNAYRYRFQDVIVELDKEKLQKNVGGEISRLFSVMQSREKTQEVSDTWKLIKVGIRYYLRFDKELRDILRETLSGLDIEKMRLSVEDEHFCKPRQDYNFAFQKNESSII